MNKFFILIAPALLAAIITILLVLTIPGISTGENIIIYYLLLEKIKKELYSE